MEVLRYPHPFLSRPASPLAMMHSDILSDKIREMFDLMYQEGGVGLAATQVGWDAQVIVINSTGMPSRTEDEMVVINPRILASSDKFTIFREGCLSCPDFERDVLRPERIGLAYLDEKMNERFGEFDGLVARIMQHEIDHLKGITIKDLK